MKIEDYVRLIAKPATDAEIDQFERDYNLIIPEQYKILLKQSNGVEVSGFLKYPLYPDSELMLSQQLASIDELRNGFLSIKKLNSLGIRFQFQDKILRICSTHEQHRIVIGHQDPIKGKIYLIDDEELMPDIEVPLHLVADSLLEFLEMIEPFSSDE